MRAIGFILIGAILACILCFSKKYITQVPIKSGKQHLSGMVISLPAVMRRDTQFNLAAGHHRYRLKWYGQRGWLIPGQKWQFFVKLKTRQMLCKSGALGYCLWLTAHQIDAVGYVKKGRLLATSTFTFSDLLSRWRYQLKWHLLWPLLKPIPYHGVLLALVMGDRSGLSPAMWQVFTHTGTSHLLAISGLHIGLLAGLVYFVVRWVMSILTILVPGLIVQTIAHVAALASALGYLLISGGSVPTLRATTMLALFCLSRITLRFITLAEVWLFTLALMLVGDPFALLTASAGLSFTAIGILIYAVKHTRGMHRFARVGYIQWLFFWAMLPLMAFWFQQVSVVSIIANFIAIPFMSWFVVPPAMVGVMVAKSLPSLAVGCFKIASVGFGWLWQYLAFLANQRFWGHQISIDFEQFSFGVLAVVLLLAPRKLPGRWLGYLLLLPFIFYG